MIEDLYTALKTNMQVFLNSSGCDFELGEEFMTELANPPRIVMYPVVEAYEVPSQRSQKVAATTTVPSKILTRLQRRTVSFEVALGGCDFNQVELELLPAFLTALDEATTSTATLGQGRWHSSVEGGQWLENGRLLYVPFSVPVTVYGTPKTLAVVTEFINSGFLEPKPEEDI